MFIALFYGLIDKSVPNRWQHKQRKRLTCVSTPMQTLLPKRNFVSLSITLSLGSRMSCRLNTYSVNERSGLSSKWKLCESRTQVQRHVCRMPRQSFPLSVQIRIPLPRQLRHVSPWALLPRCIELETISQVRK